MQRYRFNEYILSPRRRLLLRNGVEVPLIPRYFDLLVFLVEHRHEAVHRRDIFERVWSDVIVSDSALSQAIRTIRRALDDDPREPRFVRTVSRHGYRFMHDEVIEEEDLDAAGRPAGGVPSTSPLPVPAPVWSWSGAAVGGRGRRYRGGCWRAAVDGAAGLIGVGRHRAGVGGCRSRVRRHRRGGGGRRPEVGQRTDVGRQPAALVIGATLGGLAVGTFVQWMTRWSLATLLGLHLPIGGSLEGLVLGGAVGLGCGGIPGAGPTTRTRPPTDDGGRRFW